MISPAEASRTDNVFLLFMTGAKAGVTLAGNHANEKANGKKKCFYFFPCLMHFI